MVKLFQVSLDCGLKLKLFSNVSYFFFQRLSFIEMVESQKDSLHREKKNKARDFDSLREKNMCMNIEIFLATSYTV